MSTIEKNVVSAGKYLGNKEVDTMLSTYKQDRWVDNYTKLGKEDSLTAWCNLEELENLLETVRQQGGNGIRFCFAAYPKNYSENADLAGRQTLVMVATRQSGIGNKNKELFISDGKDARILAFGGIPVCPPMCSPGGTIGSLGVTLVDRGEEGMSVI